jgi:hypothetical protein
MLTGAYGFGSGSQPNAPWKPNAYNLGLANRQPDYATQTDNGLGSASPWSRQWSSPVAQSQRSQQNNPDAVPEERQEHRLDEDIGDKGDELQALMEQDAAEKRSPVEAAAKEDGTLPDSLWLSALAPAPMAALVAGLPGMSAAAEGGDAGAEGGDAGEGAPE